MMDESGNLIYTQYSQSPPNMSVPSHANDHLANSFSDQEDDSQTQPSQHVFNFDYNLAHKI